MKKLAAILGLILSSAICGHAQQTYPIVTNFESYNIFASSTSCLVSQSCVWMKLQAGTTTVAVTLSGTFVGTFPVEQSSDGGVTFATVATYTTPQTAVVFTVTGMTDFRIRSSAFTSGPALATLSSGGNQININSGGANITGQANTYGAFLQDFSAATIKIPAASGCTATAVNNLCFDSTNTDMVAWVHSASQKVVTSSATIAANNIPKIVNQTTEDLTNSLLTDDGTTLTYTGTGGSNSPAYSTATNCSSSASPAVCGSAAAGSFVLPAAATTVTVNTTKVTANSQIIVVNDDSLGTKLSVTCNTALDQVFVSGRVAATSFTITGTAPVTNPNCYSYLIVN